MDDPAVTTQDISSFTNINEFLQQFSENTVSNYIESITYNVRAQTVIIQMQKLLKTEAEEVEIQHSTREEDEVEKKIRRLSECYKEKYPVLLDNFKEWKPVREKLVELLSSSADSLDRNSTLVNSFRLMTSAADIFGTVARTYGGKPAGSWAEFAMEHASTLGLLSFFLEMTMSKIKHEGVRKMIKKDQDIFKKIAEWFQQTEELDSTIKSFFPYGIDTEITKKIAKSSSNFDDYNKIFMSIVASNVKKNVKLFKDRSFLEKADRISSSEAGKQWFQKVILENDPNFSHSINSNLSEDIQDLMKISPTDNPELYVDASRMLTSKIRLKVLLNVMTIISAGSNIYYGIKPVESDVLRELSEKTEKELKQIRKVVFFLKPSEYELDPVLI